MEFALLLLCCPVAAAVAAAVPPTRAESQQCANSSEGDSSADSDFSLLQRPSFLRGRSGYPRRPSKGELWGGPGRSWAEQSFVTEVIRTAAAPELMSFAGPGSKIPESLWGIFWMDQGGKSSVARNASYPFEMIRTAEFLASFGDAQFESDTGCITPVTCYGGPHWTYSNTWAGTTQADMFVRSRNTLSLCLKNETYIQIRQKQLLGHAYLGPVPVGGSTIAWLLGFQDAGEGYVWTPEELLSMTMVKTEWGWDRVTRVLQGKERYSCTACGWVMDKLAKMMPESHYPLIQVVDGRGQPTKYWDEFLDHMSTVNNGDEMIMTVPAA